MLNMIQTKEENSNKATLYDLICLNITNESHLSTGHLSRTKQRINSSIKGTLHHDSRKNTVNHFRENSAEMPVRGHKCKNTDTKRMYESLLFKRQSSAKQNFKRVMLSELTGRSHLAYTSKANRQSQNIKNSGTTRRCPTMENSSNKVDKEKGYLGKRARLKKSRQTLSQFFGKYDFLSYPKLQKSTIELLKRQIIKSNASNFKLLQ